MAETPTLSWSPQALEALRIMNDTSDHLFLTGRAGTGKSTLLTEFRKNTKKRIAVLAPTGVAAVNVGGQTIHSFCGFKPDITLKKVKKLADDDKRVKVLAKLDAIVIDEISMTRADILDCFEKFLRLNRRPNDGRPSNVPFGGLQIIIIGDLYQLPPIVTSQEKAAFESLYTSPYFYSATSFNPKLFHFIELEQVYRQADEGFIKLLNAIRNNSVDEDDLTQLNTRYKKVRKESSGNFVVCLTSTNAKATEINLKKLDELLYEKEFISEADITGRFDRSHMPTDEILRLKVGAQVMLLNNDPGGKWVNGTMGVVEDIDEEEEVVTVRLETGESHNIARNGWDVFEYFVDGSGGLKTNTIGTFAQYPLKLAWALTIHKSQGKTFDQVTIDLGRGTFAHGQLYVALSRCRTLEGITLCQLIEKRHVIMDWRVVRFVTELHYAKSEERQPIEARIQMIEKAIENRNKSVNGIVSADSCTLEIVYLKNNDEKSRRVIEPIRIGEMEYKGKKYLGVEAFCRLRGGVRVFRVDRMVGVREA